MKDIALLQAEYEEALHQGLITPVMMAETINICEFVLYAFFRPVHTWMNTDLGDIHHEIHKAIQCAEGVTA